jgi:uncharacterized protein YjiS (DUF1127 family)
MTYAVANTQVPLGAVTIYRAVSRISNLKASLVAWNEARATRKFLLGLSQQQLDDIGLTRP